MATKWRSLPVGTLSRAPSCLLVALARSALIRADGFHYHPLALTNPIDNPFGLSNYFLLPAFFKVSGAISQRASGSWRKD